MNITARQIIKAITELAGAAIGEYTLKDGAKSPAIGLLGMPDQRVTETRGVELLISPIPQGDYEFSNSGYAMDNGVYAVWLIQHQAEFYYLPLVTNAVLVQGSSGKIEYCHADLEAPCVKILLKFPSLKMVDIEPYTASCNWGC